MHICFLTLDFPPYRSSGLTVYAEQVVKGLAAHGHTVTVVAAERTEHDRVESPHRLDNVSVVRVPIGFADWIGFGWQAARYLRVHRENFDIVHFSDVHFAYAYYGAFVASAFQSFRQRLTSDHGQPYHTSWRNYLFRLGYYNFARWFMERPSVNRAKCIVMSSVSTQEEFIERYQVARSRTALVYLGIDTQRFDTMPSQAEARRKLNLPLDRKILLYIGFSTPRKGLEYLAQALGLMTTSVELVMVGKWEANYQERFLKALQHQQSHVRIEGYVPDPMLLDYFAAADIFVFPTLLEGFGIPLVEAMAAGLAVVTTTAGSASEVVGDAGVSVPPCDSVALANALDALLTTPDLARSSGEKGRIRARTLFDEQRVTAELEVVYENVLKEHM
jgi:glycosyltransferase involved in cell wall biosynthesis